MTIKLRDVYAAKYFRHGAGYGIYIPPDIREAAGLLPGDLFLLNYSFGVIWAVKATPDVIINRERATQILEHVFRERIKQNGRNDNTVR